jgi:hypothetical protein
MRIAANQLNNGYSVVWGIRPAPPAEWEGALRVPYREEGGMGHLVTVVLATLLGFLGGLLSFKVKSSWCPDCGTVKSCPNCAGRADPVVAQAFSGSAAKAWMRRIRNRRSVR